MRPPDLDRGLADLLPVLERAGLDPDPRELAEVLWLAGHMAAAGPAPAAAHRPPVPAPGAGPQASSADPPRDQPPPATDPASAAPAATATSAPAPRLYPRAGGRGGTRAIPYRAPAAPALPDALGLARALRPLHRRLPSRTGRRLDEEATAERIAGQRLARHGFWAPVLVPARERWFELALVIDRGATMAVWAPLLTELRRLFEYQGAFSRVRLWSLAAAGPVPRLYRGAAAGPGRPCPPGEPAAGGAWCWWSATASTRPGTAGPSRRGFATGGRGPRSPSFSHCRAGSGTAPRSAGANRCASRRAARRPGQRTSWCPTHPGPGPPGRRRGSDSRS